tara:strand:- start:10266 stop:10523 length:258 start_codon:yes stop_codon:yes gene_type:complete
MEAIVSTSFIYAILGGIVATLAFIFYEKQNEPEKQRNSLYYAGMFFIISNIIYHGTAPTSVSNQITMSTPFSANVCEMHTGTPNF